VSRIHAKSSAIFVDEYDFSGLSNSAQLVIPNELRSVMAFADSDDTFVEGKAKFQATVNGFWSTSGPNYDSYLWTNLEVASRRVGIFPGSGLKGTYGYELTTKIDRSPRISRHREAIAAHVVWGADQAAVARAVVLDKDTAVAASANGTAYNLGAVSSGWQLYGVLRLLAAPGGAGNNTIDVTVESDNAEAFLSPATVLTFTQLSQASGATFEVQTAAGALTDSWWRVVYTYAGAGTRTFNLVTTLGRRKAAG